MLVRRLLLFTYFILTAFASSANVAPEIVQPGVSPTLSRGGGAQDLNLTPLFRDPDVTGTVVRMNVRIGAVTKTADIALFDATKPITTANFLAYVNSGAFQNNFIHRSVPGFIVQGGGYRWTPTSVEAVPTFASIQNEPGISNLRGTIAMAKVADQPNSATSGWFINLADNSANLDNQNSGFTVFGRVVGNGMDVFDEIAALPRVNAGSPFDTLPVKDFSGNTILRVHTVETNAATVPALGFSVSSDDPSLVSASLVGTALRFTPSAARVGSTTVHATATDLDGASVTMDFAVTVEGSGAGWQFESGSGGAATYAFAPSIATTISDTDTTLDLGDAYVTTSRTRTFTLRNDTGSTFTGIAAAITGTNASEFSITSGAGPQDLAPGQSASVSVKFTATVGGTRSAELRFAGTDGNQASLRLFLKGTALVAGAPLITGVSAQTLTAGAVGTAELPDYRGTTVTASSDIAIAAFTQTPASGTVLPLGTHTLTFSATNAIDTTTRQTTVTVGFAHDALRVTPASAVSGVAAPAGNPPLAAGSKLTTFGTPALSDFRSIASRVTITAGKAKVAAIYTEDGAGTGHIVARQGDLAAIGSSAFRSFFDPILSPGGKLAFGAKLSGIRASEAEGVWTDLFGNLAPVLQKGAPVPGMPGTKLATVLSTSINDDALLALVKLTPGQGFITSANDTALVRIKGRNSATVLAQTGSGMLGSTVKKLTVFQPSTASAGQGRWHDAGSTIAKLTLLDKRVVLVKIESNGAQTPLLRTVDLDSAYATKLTSLGIPALGGNSVSLVVQKAIQPGTTTANDTVLIRSVGSGVFSTLLSEQAGPGQFATISDPVSNAQGKVLFAATRRGATAKTPATSGLWFTDGSTAPALIAALGGNAPDANGQAQANTAWSKFSTFALPDDSGPVFIAQIKGKAVTPRSNLGIWAVDSTGTLRQIFRTGDTVNLPTTSRTVASFTLLNPLPGSLGARRSYNATRSISLQVTFTDRTQAIVRVDVP